MHTPQILPWCIKYDKADAEWLHVLLRKDTDEVIYKVSSLLKKCLNCKFFPEKCDDHNALVDYLNNDDW